VGGIEAFGRDEELEVIRAFVSGDRPGALVLEGEVGIGKTTLWRAAVEAEEAAGRAVLVTRPSRAEAALSFSGLTDLLAVSFEPLGGDLPEPQARALETALLLRESSTPVDARALSAGVLSVLGLLSATRPVTVAIDDIQWMDGASASALAYAFRRLDGEPVRLVVTLRTETGGGSSPVLDAVPHRAVRITVGPLSSGALHRAIGEHLGGSLSRPVLLKVHEMTGGNPFYGLEVARAVLGDGPDGDDSQLRLPPSLESLVHARLRRLSRGVLQAVEPAALLADATTPVLEAVSADPARLGRHLDRAEAEEVITIAGDRVRFTHPLLAEGVATIIGPRRRSLLHRRLSELTDDPEERARHLALGTSRPDALVANAIEEGAATALHRGATAAAADLYERAATLTPTTGPDMWRRSIEAARACMAAGLIPHGKHVIAGCLDHMPPGAQRADALFVCAQLTEDDVAAAVRMLDEAIAEAADDAARVSVLRRERAAQLLVQTGDVNLALAEARAALAAAEQLGQEHLAPWLAEVCLMETWASQITPGLIERGLYLQERDPTPLVFADSPRFVQGLRHMYVDRLDEARSLLEAELADAERRGDDPTCAWVLNALTELECRAGNLRAAAERAADALLRQEQRGEEYLGGFAFYPKALWAAHAGLVDEARSAAERGILVSGQIGDTNFDLQSRAALGFLELSIGDVVAADRVLRPLPAWMVEHGFNEPSLCPAWPNAIEALVALGELPLAREYLDLYQERAERCDCPWALATAARCLGLIRSAEGDAGRAFEAFEHALVEHRRTPGPLERGRTLLCYGVALRRAKRWGDARSRMDEALELFEYMGARLWVERTREERARVGGRSRSGSELTPTEDRIARLVAAGNSNADVATQLFLSVRTVESNLTRIYLKLGVRSRTELAVRYHEALGAGH
jgi:DNA-binding CsgD family transcriptional regulator